MACKFRYVGNTTFYALPSAETVARWSVETPETFRLCPKISRAISHSPGLDTKKTETLLFIERMRGLGKRLGPMFLQLPPSFEPAQLIQLQAFLDFWPPSIPLAVEVRHPAFFKNPPPTPLTQLLLQYNTPPLFLITMP